MYIILLSIFWVSNYTGVSFWMQNILLRDVSVLKFKLKQRYPVVYVTEASFSVRKQFRVIMCRLMAEDFPK